MVKDDASEEESQKQSSYCSLSAYSENNESISKIPDVSQQTNIALIPAVLLNDSSIGKQVNLDQEYFPKNNETIAVMVKRIETNFLSDIEELKRKIQERER